MMNDDSQYLDICVGFDDQNRLFFGNKYDNNFVYNTVKPGEWNHVVIVLPLIPSANWTWYLNGAQQTSSKSHGLKVANFNGNFTRFFFGVTAPDVYRYLHYDGWIDDFRLYGGPLTATQVAALFAGTLV